MWLRLVFLGFKITFRSLYDKVFDNAARKGAYLAQMFAIGKDDMDAETQSAIKERISQLVFAAAFQGIETQSPSDRKIIRELIFGNKLNSKKFRECQLVLGIRLETNIYAGAMALSFYFLSFAAICALFLSILLPAKSDFSWNYLLAAFVLVLGLIGLLLVLYSLIVIFGNWHEILFAQTKLKIT